MMKDKVIDQAGCFENTLALPQRGKTLSVSGFALLSFRRGTVPAQPSTRFSQSPILIILYLGFGNASAQSWQRYGFLL